MNKTRRNILRNLALAPLLFGAQNLLGRPHTLAAGKQKTRIQYSVNAYSFNSLLNSGKMTFFDMMDFAADIGLDAVDLTGYYFASYPKIPENEELFRLKRKALELGLNISWTGIRNDFVNPDTESRNADIALIREWLSASSKLGASIMRVFAGKHEYKGYSKDQVKDWLIEDLKTSTLFAKESGVLIGLQHHNDFLFSSDEVIDIIERVNSEWIGLILDVGSLHADDPYDEIQRLAPFADYWFIKEHVYPKGRPTAIDMEKIASILKNECYQGYVSFESLSGGDPKQIITSMHDSLRREYEKLP